MSDNKPHPENCGELSESDGSTDVTVTAPPSSLMPSTAEYADESKLAESVHASGVAGPDEIRSTEPATSNNAVSLDVAAEYVTSYQLRLKRQPRPPLHDALQSVKVPSGVSEIVCLGTHTVVGACAMK
jgi:hypothetical protein